MSRLSRCLFKPAAMFGRSLLAAATVVLVFPACSVHAATGVDGADDLQPTGVTLRVNVREVGIILSAVGPHNRSIPSLTANDLVVFDEGVPVQVTSVQTSQLPIRLGLLIDASASLQKELQSEFSVAAEFASHFLHSDDTALLTTFAGKPQPMIPITRGEDAQARLADVHAHGLTALYDSVVEACSELSASRYDRAVLILLSDGGDNYSYHTQGAALSAAERSGAVIYTVFIHTKNSEDDGEPWMKQLAARTGGKEFEVSDPKKLESVLADIEQDIRSGYELTFRPATQISDGKFRRISIVSRNRGLTIRAQAGYVAK
jgi:Ca-activated chloride channel family protein